MTVDERRNILYMFLNEHKAVKTYSANMESKYDSRELAIVEMNRLLESDDPQHCITVGFGWKNSPEGFDYWADLCEKWKAKFK